LVQIGFRATRASQAYSKLDCIRNLQRSDSMRMRLTDEKRPLKKEL
jgi:hypothetical protein